MSRQDLFEAEPGVRLHYEMAGKGEQALIVANAGVLPDSPAENDCV